MANEFTTKNGIISPKAQLGDGTNDVAPLNLAPGFSVAAPQNGDLWSTVSGLWYRAGGASVQIAPAVGGGGSGTYYVPATVFNNGGVVAGGASSASPNDAYPDPIISGTRPWLLQINTTYNFSMPTSITEPLAGRAYATASLNNANATVSPALVFSAFGPISVIELFSPRRMATFTTNYIGVVNCPAGQAWQPSFNTSFTLHGSSGLVLYQAGITNSATHTVFIREL